MSPTISSWAVDLTQVGAIYPFLGSEWLLYIAGLAFWLGFHVWQIIFENRTLAKEEKHFSGETLKKAIEANSP